MLRVAKVKMQQPQDNKFILRCFDNVYEIMDLLVFFILSVKQDMHEKKEPHSYLFDVDAIVLGEI